MKLFNDNLRAIPYISSTGDKIYPLVVDIKKGIKSSDSISFVSADNNTGYMSIRLVDDAKDYTLTGSTVVCTISRPDSSSIDIQGEIIEGSIVEIFLGSVGTIQEGIHQFDIKVIREDEKIVGTPIMSYNVERSLVDGGSVVDDDRLPILTSLITEVTDLRETTKRINQQSITATTESKSTTETAKVVISELQATKQEMDSTLKNINNAIASGTQDLEVKEARDGEVSLKARLDRDLAKGKVIEQDIEGSYITVSDSVEGNITNMEILGNTVQNATNLADIKSVGIKKEDGHFKMSISSCGKNLIPYLENGGISLSSGLDVVSTDRIRSGFIKINKNSNLKLSIGGVKPSIGTYIFEYDSAKNFIKNTGGWNIFIDPNTVYVRVVYVSSDVNIKAQLEYTNVTQYEPYQSTKSTISLPCPLEKVGDVADRLYYDDVEKAWCIDKYINTLTEAHTYNWYKASIHDNIQQIGVNEGLNLVHNDNPISNRFRGRVGTENVGGICKVINNSSSIPTLYVWIDVSKLSSNDIKGYKQYFTDNPTIFKVVRPKPQKIILPLDVQITLNSFFGTTHMWLECGDVEGTIKAIVPKSLGASVQSLSTDRKSVV